MYYSLRINDKLIFVEDFKYKLYDDGEHTVDLLNVLYGSKDYEFLTTLLEQDIDIELLDNGVMFAKLLNVCLKQVEYHLLNDEAFSKMKQGIRIINESRAEVVDDIAMTKALDSGKVAKYVTDFPNETILKAPNVIAMPHLGACTPESEDRCAVMAANELFDYLENGNIKNSVNLPNASLERMGNCRLCVLHRNKPRMITRILDFISARNINVEHMINKPRGGYAYTIVDLGKKIGPKTAEEMRSMEDILRLRVLYVD